MFSHFKEISVKQNKMKQSKKLKSVFLSLSFLIASASQAHAQEEKLCYLTADYGPTATQSLGCWINVSSDRNSEIKDFQYKCAPDYGDNPYIGEALASDQSNAQYYYSRALREYKSEVAIYESTLAQYQSTMNSCEQQGFNDDACDALAGVPPEFPTCTYPEAPTGTAVSYQRLQGVIDNVKDKAAKLALAKAWATKNLVATGYCATVVDQTDSVTSR
jgi:hypothetical protein